MILRLFSAFALLTPLSSGLPQDAEWLKTQEKLLAESPEQSVYDGARACAQKGGEKAAVLLLELLGNQLNRGLPAPHYRDIAWDSLIEVKDTEGREAVAHYLDKSDLPMVREWCADLLGLYGDEAFGKDLIGALKDREAGVKRAAARALGRLAFAPAEKPLKKLVRSKDPRTRGHAVAALAAIDIATYGELLIKHVDEDKDSGVQCMLLSAVPSLLPEQAEVVSIASLGKDDWRPRLQAIRNLGDVRTKSAVDALVQQAAEERMCIGREAVAMLVRITGLKHSRAELWQKWWKDNRETFTFSEEVAADGIVEDERSSATYNGIRIRSDHAAFLMDTSAWMKRMLAKRQQRRIDVASTEMEAAFQSLTPPFLFNIYLYAEDIEALSEKKPLEFSKRTTKKALRFIEEAEAKGRKDIWKALFTTISSGKYDAIYMLSSGEPDVGWVVHENHLNYHLAELIRFHPVTVHTIAYTDQNGHQVQMDRIARTTGGESRHVD